MTRQLDEAIIDRGIRNTHYFNGRLLTADDLRADQAANRQQHWQLGQAIGEGVISGLEVSLIEPGGINKLPVVEVSQGLALNRLGQMLTLPGNESLTLTPAQETVAAADIFSDCDKESSFGASLAGGFYVLVIKPASGFQESAPVRGLFGAGTVAGCGSRYEVAGVQFGLRNFSLNDLTGVSTATRNQLNQLLTRSDVPSQWLIRNILAHLCFAVEEQNAAAPDPFKSPSDNDSRKIYGALGSLRSAGKLGECEVPLALIHLLNRSVNFFDNWAVRRLARRIIELDVLSIFPGYGYERLLQFQQQLISLVERLGNVNAVRVQDYFRFVPPVGFFPITGARSPRGYHPTRFFESFVTGQPSEIGHGKFADVLHRSFRYPAIDLQAGPAFQLYRVRENVSAVSTGRSNQLQQVFISRSLHGPLAEDGVGKTMQDAWEVYRGLIKRRAFLPAGNDEAVLAAQISITSAIRDVMEMANRQAALAKNWALDKTDALDALQQMYQVQKELAAFFVSRIPGLVHTLGREEFGQELADLLDKTIPGGAPGLLPSIKSGNLIAAVNAQNAVNLFIGTFSGEGVAIGPFFFTYQNSPNGVNLVPGSAQPFPQVFKFSNSTDKTLTFDLTAEISAPTGSWQGRAKLVNSQTGAELSGLTLAAGGEATINVLVSAPGDAKIGETATLTLTAAAPSPTNRTSTTTFDKLKVAGAGGPAITRSVSFERQAQVVPALGAGGVAQPGTTYSYLFNLRYNAPNGPPSTEFLIRVNLTSATLAEWIVSLGSGMLNPAPGVFTNKITLTTAGPNPQFEMKVKTPARPAAGASSKTASLAVEVESLGLNPAISTSYEEDTKDTLNLVVAP